MTKKHFAALAEAIRLLPPDTTRQEVACVIAVVLRRFAPTFDADRFFTAPPGLAPGAKPDKKGA